MATHVSGNIDMENYETRVLKEYYSNSEFFLSPEWILKVLAVVTCIAASALFLAGGGCGGVSGLAAGGAGVALGCGGAGALLCAVQALRLPAAAPRAWLLADITILSVMGILMLVSAILTVVFCEMATAAGYLLAPLGIAASVLVTSSAVATYHAATRHLDAALPRVEPPRPQSQEQEV